MPIIKSAQKQMRQALKKRQRNYRVRAKLHTTIKEFQLFIKEGKKQEATTFLSKLFKVVDTSVKKNIIAKNNGDRKKSNASKLLNKM